MNKKLTTKTAWVLALPSLWLGNTAWADANGRQAFSELPTIARPLPEMPTTSVASPIASDQQALRPVAQAVIARPLPTDWQPVVPTVPVISQPIAPPVVVQRVPTPAVTPIVSITPFKASTPTTTSTLANPASIVRPASNTAPLAPDTRQAESSQSSLQALSQFYNEAPMCQGTWLYPIVGTLPPNDGTLSATATHAYYDNDTRAELSGNVVVSQNDRQIRADSVHIDPATGQSQALGNVAFGGVANNTRQDLLGVAQQLDYNTQTGEAKAHNIAFASQGLHAHGYAERLTHSDNNVYELDNSTFSTCPPTRRTWQIDAKNITLDRNTGRGVARHSTFKVHDTPIFYLPYFNFPLDNRRASGFLVPSVGINSTDGIQLTTPYYFNLASNYDATLTPTFYTHRNPRLNAELRYLHPNLGAGKLDTAYLPSDKQYQNKDRSHLFFDHTLRPLAEQDLQVNASYRYVSDSAYLADFDKLGVSNNSLNLARVIGVTYNNEHLNASLKAQTFQLLNGTDRFGNPILDKNRPYSRLPQLDVLYRAPKDYTRGFDVTASTHSAYFKKSIKDGSDTEKSGVRLYNNVSASLPLVRSYGYVMPKVGVTQLFMRFDEDSLSHQNLTKEDGTYNVIVPNLSVDSGLFLQKNGAPFGWFGNQGYQVLTPRLKYLYSPYKNQRQMPNFETSVASMSYNQLLADSWFLGYDRVSDLHAITPAVNYRYLDGQGRTRLEVGIAEQFYLRDSRVTVNGATGFQKGNSGLAWQLSANPSGALWFDVSGSFTREYRPNAFIGAVRYQPSDDMLFNIGVIERKENLRLGQLPLSAYAVSAIVPVREQWQLLGTAQYDSKYRGFMDALVGVGYEDCCIGIAVYGRQYRNDLNPDDVNRAVMAELRLTGLTGSGRLGKLLKERVLGFNNTF